jgi:hypothetical protein
VPIFNSAGVLSGIIDAEAFKPNLFTPAVIAIIAQACLQIPVIDSLYDL